MGAIKGLHHVAYKIVPENYEKIVTFYRDFLELPLVRQSSDCTMLGFGN